MPADVTPTPFSTSKILALPDDTTEQRIAQITPTNVTALVASVNQTGEAMFGRALVLTQSYALTNVVLSTFPALSVSTSTAFTISRVVSSAPIVLVSMTQNHQVVSTNTTVFNALGTPSSLLLALPGAGNDVVSYKVAVVADTVV